MTIKIYQEKDKSYGARIQIGRHIIYAIGDDMVGLQNSIKDGMECAFVELPPQKRSHSANILQMLYSPVSEYAS